MGVEDVRVGGEEKQSRQSVTAKQRIRNVTPTPPITKTFPAGVYP
jgi:hypothetical protein